MIKNIVLDVDETLLHSFSSKSEALESGGYDMVTIDRSYYVRFRPGFSAFLEYLLNHYRVGIYSVATADYVSEILSTMVDLSRFSFVWSRDHCQRQELPAYGLFQSAHQYTYKKPLSRVVKATGWNIDETVMIDDSIAATGTLNAYRLLIEPFEGALDDQHLFMVESFLEHHRLGEYPTHLIPFDEYVQPSREWLSYD